MNEKKLKDFLVNGFHSPENEKVEEVAEQIQDEPLVIDAVVCEVPETEPVREEPTQSQDMDAVSCAIRNVEDELLKIRYILEDIRDEDVKVDLPDMTKYLTTREQLKAVTEVVDNRNAETSNKTLIRAMEQISVMREDFFKLCQGMREKIGTMTAEDVLSSFEAYSVDMENILLDGGVYIGKFPYDRLNTLHQRIIGVIPTDDEEKNGMIAERLTDGYKIGNKVLLKEKVTIYRFTEGAPKAETASETDSTTEEIRTADTQEEEE